MIDVFFDDVVEYGDSAFMGCELLAEDGNANCCVPCCNFSEYVVEITAMVQPGGGVDVITKPFNKRVCADNRRVGDVVCGREMLTLSLPSKIGGT